jgi:hypothetical protein
MMPVSNEAVHIAAPEAVETRRAPGPRTNDLSCTYDVSQTHFEGSIA